MGRPRKNPEDRKDYHLRVPLASAQRRLIEAASAAEDEDLAAWARGVLLDAAKRVVKKHAGKKGDLSP
jgi:uncharacterized protein (DUF1778 family)